MEQAERIELVERARGGDRPAFAELVRAYQDLVAATAYGWLGDAETARDVAQEAFLDAHLHLDQLREPAAFGAWLRRIVIKHCDRATRRGSLLLTPLDQVSEPTSDESGPARATEDGEAAERLRLAVESLPAPERQVIALHYFAEATGPELAAFLELPLSTVKKRLRTARARLRTEGERLMQETMNRLRPTLSGRLSREVSFFVALRAGDLEEVARMLAVTPGLVDARQEWDAELVLEGVLPFANKATALITAVEQNNLDMLKLLLDAGADPDGACGCETMESPLWAATLLDREAHVRELLERSADPNRASAAGNYPLHLAAMRGREALVDLLLRHGADPNLLDAGARYVRPLTPLDDAERPGRTAAQWAAANGHQAIVRRLNPGSGESQAPLGTGRRMA
ncbi:MAG: sigma-70 family RNA polymerase sigma factor, partial [Pseudomonadales bacterium]